MVHSQTRKIVIVGQDHYENTGDEHNMDVILSGKPDSYKHSTWTYALNELPVGNPLIGDDLMKQLKNLEGKFPLANCMALEVDEEGYHADSAFAFWNKHGELFWWTSINKYLPTTEQLTSQVFELLGDQTDIPTLVAKSTKQLQFITESTLGMVQLVEGENGAEGLFRFMPHCSLYNKKMIDLYRLLHVKDTSKWYTLRSNWRKKMGIKRDNRTYAGQPDRNMLKAA